MATIGQSLSTPEAGWKRYDDTNSLITYGGGRWVTSTTQYAYNGSYKLPYNASCSHYMKFNFIGTKLRLICSGGRSTTSWSNIIYIYINSVLQATVSSITSSGGWKTLVADIQGLINKEHYVEIINGTTKYFCPDAIDIDINGSLKTYNVINTKCIIYKTENNQIYGYI